MVGPAVMNWRGETYFDCSYRGLLVPACYLVMLALVITRPLPAAGALCFFVGFGLRPWALLYLGARYTLKAPRGSMPLQAPPPRPDHPMMRARRRHCARGPVASLASPGFS